MVRNEQDNLVRVTPTSTDISHRSSRLGSPRNMSADNVVNGVSVIELEGGTEQVHMYQSPHTGSTSSVFVVKKAERNLQDPEIGQVQEGSTCNVCEGIAV